MLSLTIRRVIYIAFILGFLITAPILVLYTAGYRYNFKKSAVQKVGSISVKPYPKEADIYLDDKLQLSSRPDNTLRINNLLPGKYKITVSLGDYYPWEKYLEVFSNVNTFVNHLVLFKKNIPENILNNSIEQSLASPDGKNLSYLTADQLITINLTNLQTTILKEKVKNYQIVSWSKDSDNLLIKDKKNQFFIYTLSNPEKELPLSLIVPLNFQNIRWDEKNDYLLYATSEGNFYQINILTRDYQLLYNFKNTPEESYGYDFLYKNNEIYYTHRTSEGTFLEKNNLIYSEKENKPQKLLKLSTTGNFFFYTNDNGTVSLIDREKQKFYLLDENFTQVFLEVEAKNFDWDSSGQKLLYYNDFEIWLYNLENKNQELITRYGQIIQNAEFCPKIDYLVSLVDGSLTIMELDSRDQRNVIELVKKEKIDNFYISNKSQDVFFTGQIGAQAGLFKINI